MPRIDKYNALASLAADDELIAWDTSAGEVVNVTPPVLATRLATDSAFSSQFAPSDPKVTAQNQNALRYFRTQLARRDSIHVDMVFLGDSLTEGEGSTGVTKRWTTRVAEDLRRRFPVTGVTGGLGYVEAANNSSTMSWSSMMTMSGGANAQSSDGLNKRCVYLGAAGHKLTFTTPTACTGFEVFYEQGGGAVFSVKVDSGAGTNIDSSGTVQAASRTFTGLANTTHSIELAWVSGTGLNGIIHGICLHNGDETYGIRPFCGGFGGADSTHFVTSGYGSRWVDQVTLLQPALVTICLGANDLKGSQTVAQYKANLIALIAYIRTKSPSSSIVLIAPYEIGVTPSTVDTWANYVTAIQQIVTADSTLAYFDIWNRFGTQKPPSVAGMIAGDNQHPTNAGQAYWADAFAAFLAA